MADIAEIVISSVDKKTKPGEKIVRLCNFTDVYHNWAIKQSDYDSFMVASASDNNINKLSLKKGFVAFTKDSETRDDIGISTYIADDFDDVVLGYHCALAKPNEKIVYGKYLNAFMSSDYIKKYFELNATGSGMRFTLAVSTMEDMPIMLPGLNVQKKIGDMLSTLDKRIENLRAQNRVLEQTAKTIYDYSFLQCAGHQTTYNKTLNRNIPADWEVKRLGDLVSVSKESLNPQNYPEKQFKHFSIPSFDDNGSYSLEYGKDIFSNKFIVNDNHVLISKLNPWKNRAVWCDENDDAIGSTEFVTLLPRKLENKAFVFSIVKSDSFIEYCSDAATGTSHSHRRVSPDIMMKFPIAYDEKTVIKFNAQVTPLFKKQSVNTKQIEALTTQRNTLLPLLMTGQIEV